MYRIANGEVLLGNRAILDRGEALAFLRKTATRKERSNGHVRAIERALDRNGSCLYERPWQVANVGVSTLAISIATSAAGYSVLCESPNADIALRRANDYRIAFPDWKAVNRAISKTRVRVPSKPPIPRIPRVQYPNREMTWYQAVGFIAYAYRLSMNEVQGLLKARPTSSNPRYRIVRMGLPMEIEIQEGEEVSNSASVKLFCAKENRHPAYRRLRKALRWEFHVSAEEKRRLRKERKQIRNFLRLQRHLLLASG